MKWYQKLTKAERAHLRHTANCTTLKQVKDMAQGQKEMRKTHPRTEPCWDCKTICNKLGIET